MKDRQPMSAAEEQRMLQHFRQHQGDEPSAALDARILAAAAAQARQQRPRPRGWGRLHAWLFGGSARRHWSLALGSVAVLGLGLSLSLRTFQQAPASYDSPAPAAPALQRYAAPAPQKKALAEPSRSSDGAVSVMADSVAPLPEAAEVQTPLPDELRAALQQILRLRDDGRYEQAAARLTELQQRYPALDMEAQLKRLHMADEAPR